MDNSEARLSRLEENCYFLEERLQALDGQIAAQQAELENLTKKVERLSETWQELREAFGMSISGRSTTELPPHHIAKFW